MANQTQCDAYTITKQKILFLATLLAIFMVGIWLQFSININWDVSFLSHAALQLINGGTYTRHFFETNPPMILFIYSIPAAISQFTTIKLTTSLRFFVFSVALFSLLFCYLNGKAIFNSTKSLLLILILLAVTYVFLPINQFGQREHLMIMLVMPYFFSSARQLQTTANLFYEKKILLQIITGIAAGIGFSIKPFFIIPFCLVELLFILSKKNILAWLRYESVTILSVMVLYLVAVFLITPDYVLVIVPFLFKLYYLGFGDPLTKLIFEGNFIFCCAATLMGLLSIAVSHNRFSDVRIGETAIETQNVLIRVLVCGLIGFLITYLIEDVRWYYHILPAVTLACVLFGILTITPGLNYLWKMAFITVCSTFPILVMAQIFYLALEEKYHGTRYKLVQYLRSEPRFKNCYLMSTNAVYFPSIVDESGKRSVSRFPNYWWLPGLIKLSRENSTYISKKFVEKDKCYFINAITDDINSYHPDLILVDNKKYNVELKSRNFNYINFFSTNPRFSLAWNHYHFLKQTDDFLIYARNGITNGSD